MVLAHEIITVSYVIELSTKSVVRCDAEELPKLMEGMRKGVPVLLKQGLVNPSYIVAVREDTERKLKFIDDTKYPQDAERRARGLEPLKNIFAGTPLLAPPTRPQIDAPRYDTKAPAV